VKLQFGNLIIWQFDNDPYQNRHYESEHAALSNYQIVKLFNCLGYLFTIQESIPIAFSHCKITAMFKSALLLFLMNAIYQSCKGRKTFPIVIFSPDRLYLT